MGRNGNAPRALSCTTRRGAPWVSLLTAFVVGLIALLPFPSWQQLVGFITSATVISFGPGSLTLGALRRRLPDQRRGFRVPGGDLVPVLAFASSDLIVYWTGWTTDWKLFLAIALGLVLLGARELLSSDTPPLELRSGATWMLPWLAGLAAISYVGDFDGGRGWVSFWPAIAIVVAFSVAVYYFAMTRALPTETIREHVATAEQETEGETGAHAA